MLQLTAETLTVTTRDAFDLLLEDLESRLEVMADDGLGDSPVYDDADAVRAALTLIAEPAGFPLAVTLANEFSAEQRAQLAQSVENVADNATGEGVTVRAYFEQAFPAHVYVAARDPVDLESMPLDSHCGADCKAAVDAGAALAAQVRRAFGDDKPEHFQEIGEIVADVCGCFICG